MATVAAPVVKASAAVAVKASAPRIAPAQPNAMQVRGMPSSATQGESLRIAQARHRVFTHREQLFIALAAAIRSLEAVPFPACVAVQQRVGGAILPGGDRINAQALASHQPRKVNWTAGPKRCGGLERRRCAPEGILGAHSALVDGRSEGRGRVRRRAAELAANPSGPSNIHWLHIRFPWLCLSPAPPSRALSPPPPPTRA